MILYLKNTLFFLFYSSICCLMLTGHMHYEKGFYYSFYPIMMMYYLIMLHPGIHEKYIFQMTERYFVRWRIVWILFFHACLNHDVLLFFFMYLYKELVFVINYAETRLAKIDESIYEKMMGYRVAHLHLNVFQDDMDNRFHENCYNTNRLYLIESTNTSRETQLGISNYRDIRRRGKAPREMTETDASMYKASSNKGLLLADRQIMVVYPMLILIGFSLRNYMSAILIIGNLLSYMFTRALFHDFWTDLNYAVVSVIYVLSQNNNMLVT
jgi:hypothetical protein